MRIFDPIREYDCKEFSLKDLIEFAVCAIIITILIALAVIYF